MRPKFLIISTEIITDHLAGPGMRYLEMARALSEHVDVTLAIPGETSLAESGIQIVSYAETRPQELRALVESHDVVLVTTFTLNKFSFLRRVETRLVVDLYAPNVFENLFYYLDESLAQQADINRQSVDLLNRVACLGDFFICGSERQRDLWLGLLLANQRINPYTFAQDPDLRGLIDVVGIGFPEREPIQRPFARGVRSEFPVDCRIVLWGGGVWDWLDPLTLVRAWPQVVSAYPQARLVFLGTRHPNPEVPQHRVAGQLEALADQIGEKERTIFFFEWLSYADREALLSEADMGVTLHSQHIETHFSIRTRVLDYFWARLPVMLSEGDVTSQWVQADHLGKVVPTGNPDAVAQALVELLSRPKADWAPAFEAIHKRLNWSEVVKPLQQYLLQGDFAPDYLARGSRINQPKAGGIWRSRWARARYIWRKQGFRTLLIKIGRQLQAHLAKML